VVYSADTGHDPGGTGEVLSALRRLRRSGRRYRRGAAPRPFISQPAVPVAASIAAGVPCPLDAFSISSIALSALTYFGYVSHAIRRCVLSVGKV
jgi:hypothetical protein